MRCPVCKQTFTALTPASNVPGHSDQWKQCAGSYKPPIPDKD